MPKGKKEKTDTMTDTTTSTSTNGTASKIIDMAKVEKGSLNTSLPKEILGLVAADAERLGITNGAIARMALAEKYGYTLTNDEVRRVVKYESKEAQVAAQKAREGKRHSAVVKLLEAGRGGKVSAEQKALLSALGIDLDDLVATA